ncbi:MAG: hypothetical protein JWO43_546 [Candidatus Adlerbacteria bacterium]|nr:hypothetical protein [Candidatus Adlerbacteria bacterium]
MERIQASFFAAFLLAGLVPSASMAGESAACSWNCRWSPKSASDRQVDLNTATSDFQARHGGLAPTTNIGTMNVTNSGPSNSSSVTNVGNLNSTSAVATQNGVVSINTGQTTGAGASQTGAAQTTSNTDGSKSLGSIIR